MTIRRHQKKSSLLDWHPADIVAACRKAGWSMRRLAIHHGYHPTTLTIALRRPYPRAEQLIAKAIGLAPKDIWPSRYDERRPLRGVGGAPTHKTGPHIARAKKSTTPHHGGNGYSPEAA